jgi:hypothetical protein
MPFGNPPVVGSGANSGQQGVRLGSARLSELVKVRSSQYLNNLVEQDHTTEAPKAIRSTWPNATSVNTALAIRENVFWLITTSIFFPP